MSRILFRHNILLSAYILIIIILSKSIIISQVFLMEGKINKTAYFNALKPLVIPYFLIFVYIRKFIEY